MQLMACHFVHGLGIPSAKVIKYKLHGNNKELDKFDEEFDIDTSLDVEASADDVDAMLEAEIMDFEAGDVIDKVMAFVNQV